MALFGRKKLTLDEILQGISELSDEDKAKVKDKMEDLYKAEDEREIDKIEEEKADDKEDKDEKAEEKQEESEEVGKDVDEVENEVKDDEAALPTEQAKETTPKDVPADTMQDKKAEENAETSLSALMERITSLEEKFSEFSELKSLMEEFTAKQGEQLGYKGSIPGAKKDISEMSASELKRGILSGEY